MREIKQSQNPVYKETSGIARPDTARYLYDPRDNGLYRLAEVLKTAVRKGGEQYSKNKAKQDNENDQINEAHAQMGLDRYNGDLANNRFNLLTTPFERDAYDAKLGQIEGTEVSNRLVDKYNESGMYNETDPMVFQKWLHEEMAAGAAEAAARGPAYYAQYVKEQAAAAKSLAEAYSGAATGAIKSGSQRALANKLTQDVANADDRTARADLREFHKNATGNEYAPVTDAFDGNLAPRSLLVTESGGNFAAENDAVGAGGLKGHGGRVQFGHARLAEARAAGAIPRNMTMAQFIKNPAAQKSAEVWHFRDIHNFIDSNGLDSAIGRKINGVEVTRDGMVAVAHLGGRKGLRSFIRSNGKYNKADRNGTSLTDYLRSHKGNKTDPSGVASAEQAIAGWREKGLVDWYKGKTSDASFAEAIGVEPESLNEFRTLLDRNESIKKFALYVEPAGSKKSGSASAQLALGDDPTVAGLDTKGSTVQIQRTIDEAENMGLSNVEARDVFTQTFADEIKSGRKLPSSDEIESIGKRFKLNAGQREMLRMEVEYAKTTNEYKAKQAERELVTQATSAVMGDSQSLQAIQQSQPKVYARLLAALNGSVDTTEQEYRTADFIENADYASESFPQAALQAFASGTISKQEFAAQMKTHELTIKARNITRIPAIGNIISKIEMGITDTEVKSVYRQALDMQLGQMAEQYEGGLPPITEVLTMAQQLSGDVSSVKTKSATTALDRLPQSTGS